MGSSEEMIDIEVLRRPAMSVGRDSLIARYRLLVRHNVVDGIVNILIDNRLALRSTGSGSQRGSSGGEGGEGGGGCEAEKGCLS